MAEMAKPNPRRRASDYPNQKAEEIDSVEGTALAKPSKLTHQRPTTQIPSEEERSRFRKGKESKKRRGKKVPPPPNRK